MILYASEIININKNALFCSRALFSFYNINIINVLKIRWFKDSEPLQAKTRFTTNYDLYRNIASLKIDDIRPCDEGIYKCVAFNDAGLDETSAEAFIIKSSNIEEIPYIEPDKFRNLYKDPVSKMLPENTLNYMPPIVIKPLTDFIINEGNDIKLICQVDGYPIPQVYRKQNYFYIYF